MSPVKPESATVARDIFKEKLIGQVPLSMHRCANGVRAHMFSSIGLRHVHMGVDWQIFNGCTLFTPPCLWQSCTYPGLTGVLKNPSARKILIFLLGLLVAAKGVKVVGDECGIVYGKPTCHNWKYIVQPYPLILSEWMDFLWMSRNTKHGHQVSLTPVWSVVRISMFFMTPQIVTSSTFGTKTLVTNSNQNRNLALVTCGMSHSTTI